MGIQPNGIYEERFSNATVAAMQGQMCMHCVITTPTVHLHSLNEGIVHSTMFMLVASVTYLVT